MPRFERLTGDFEIATGGDDDPVVWRFARTVEIEREFTAADDLTEALLRSSGSRRRLSGPRSPSSRLLHTMLAALRGWEGVLDAEGRAIPYSEDAFFEYIPAALRREVLARWVQTMRGEDGGRGGPAHEGAAAIVPHPPPARAARATDAPPPEGAGRAAQENGGTGGLAREAVAAVRGLVASCAAADAERQTPDPERPSPPPPARAARATDLSPHARAARATVPPPHEGAGRATLPPDAEPLCLLDDSDLDADWDFEDAVDAILRRKQLAEQHEPLY